MIMYEIEPLLFYNYNYCFNCKTNSIELYSYQNYPQHYAKILEMLKAGVKALTLDKYATYTMRCSRCGKEYKIYWDENGIPRPIDTGFQIEVFMRQFKEDSRKGRPNILGSSYTLD